MKEPTEERIAWASAALAGNPASASARSWCSRCALLLGAGGAGIALISRGSAGGVLCASGPMADAAEALQFMLGEGPGFSAAEWGEPVLEPDLANPLELRWPSFRDGAVQYGVGAEFSFPLRAGNLSIGALDLYQEGVGELTDEQHANALAVAVVTTRIVLAAQARADGDDLALPLDAVAGARAHVDQAAGIVAAQADLTTDDALLMLRAYAFAHELALDAVARSVIARSLRFDA
jgi:hypothetical protein